MSAPPDSLKGAFDCAFAALSQGLACYTPQLTPHEVGTITSVATGVAKVSGLPGVGFDELVIFPGDVLGIAFNVDADEIGVVLLGEYWHLHAGDEVQRTDRVMDVAVGDELLGASSTRLVGPSITTGRWPPASACPLNVPPHRLWTALPSRCLFRRASKSSMRSFLWAAASAS